MSSEELLIALCKHNTFFTSVLLIALNAQIRVADRPMTKQGLTGMKTAAGRGKNINLENPLSPNIPI